MSNNHHQVLQKAGYPTVAVTLDFETFFSKDYSLSDLSNIEYIFDERFEFTGLGVFESKLPSADPRNCAFWPPEHVERVIRRLQGDYGPNFEKCVLVGQNLMFDALILKEKFGIIPVYTIDTLNLSRHEDSRRRNGLKYLCEYYKLGVQKGDTKQFKGLRWGDMSPTQQISMAKYCCDDIIATTELFRLLLPLLSNPLVELKLQQHTLNMYLVPQFAFDFELAKKLQKGMQEKLDEALDKVKWVWGYRDVKKHKTIIKVIRSAKFVDALQSVLPKGEQVPMKMGKNGNIAALAKTDEMFQALLQHPKQKVRELCNARVDSKSWPNWIKRLQSMSNQAALRGGKIATALNYYAGHLGRWGGTQNTNQQNLPGSGRGGAGIDFLLQQIRYCLKTPEGYILGIADASQIEARIAAWLAGQDDLVKGFADGEDIYSEFGTELFKEPVWKPTGEEPPGLYKIVKVRREFSKAGILGFIFGLGKDTLYNNCLANPDLKPAFDSGELDFNFVAGLIKQLRIKYYKIPELWNTVEKAFRFVTKYPREIVSLDRGLKFYNDKGTVIIELPSTRQLKYPHARVVKRDISWQWGHLWGGAIVENLCQSVARDIFGNWILESEKNNIPVILHSHDELVVLLHKSNADKELQTVIDLIKVQPAWTAGLPLVAEGELTIHYKK